MDLELVLWCYVPILIGLLVILGSYSLTVKRRDVFGLVVTLLILAFNSLAIYILAQTVLGAYPTYTPHLFILISIILLAVQYLVQTEKNTRVKK